MLNKLEMDSAAELLYVAETYGLFDMKMEVLRFIDKNKEQIDKFKNTEGWKKFFEPHYI